MSVWMQDTTPPGVDQLHVYLQRSGSLVLRRDVDWWHSTAEPGQRFSPAAVR